MKYIRAYSIAIGNPLKLSPDFPPLSTVRAAFTAHSAPSKTGFIQIYTHLLLKENYTFTLIKFQAILPMLVVY